MKKLTLLIALLTRFAFAQTLSYPSFPEYMDINGQVNISILPFTSLAVGVLPTTLAGYGITDGLTSASNILWSKITGAPTIVSAFANDAGYITTATLGVNTPLVKFASYTIVSSDLVVGKQQSLQIAFDCTGGNYVCTLPSATSYPGYLIYINKIDSTTNTLSINGISSDNVINVKGWSKIAASVNGIWVNN